MSRCPDIAVSSWITLVSAAGVITTGSRPGMYITFALTSMNARMAVRLSRPSSAGRSELAIVAARYSPATPPTVTGTTFSTRHCWLPLPT
eukprot:4529136-Heterocapsa_arctica.AAC.1